MGRDELISMAREAGMLKAQGEAALFWHPEIERFAALVAAKEREACAKVCDEKARMAYAAHHLWPTNSIHRLDKIAQSVGMAECAAVIRARVAA